MITIDDITGKELVSHEGETILFSYRGVDYQIDTIKGNADKFDKAMEPYIRAASRIGGRKTRAANNKGPTEVKVDNRAVRAWAAANGYEVSPRGRLSRDVVEKYKAAGH